MAEEAGTPTDGGQESADVLAISDEDFDALLAADAPSQESGNTDDGYADDGSQGDGGDQSETAVAREVAGAVKSGMAEVLEAVKVAPAANSGTPPVDAMAALKDHITKSIISKQGLNETGAGFMAESVMAGIGPVITIFQQKINAQQGTIDGLRSETVIGDLDRNIGTWLDGHNITNVEDRTDITELSKTRAVREHGDAATSAHVRAEVAKIANRFVKSSVAGENGDTDVVIKRNAITPAPGGDGVSGQDDIAQRVLKSTDPRDTMGGDRFQKLVASFIGGGGQ